MTRAIAYQRSGRCSRSRRIVVRGRSSSGIFVSKLSSISPAVARMLSSRRRSSPSLDGLTPRGLFGRIGRGRVA